ncbi:MAG: gliding motility-associated C-terminal domain-containing protein, partial [Pedobacter sp.]
NDAALSSVAFVGASFNTPILTANKTYYVTVKGSNKCENTSATVKVVTVTVNRQAIASDITLSVPASICGSGSATISASSVTVTNPIFTWYSDASLTTSVFVGATFNTPVLTTSTTYYVTVKGSNSCENTAANAQTVTVVVKPNATSADITVVGNTTLCENSSTLLTAGSITVTNPIFTWYSNAALTNVVFTGSAFTTPILNATTTYYVTVKGDNRCENTPASAKVVVVTVNARPNNPTVANTGTNICAGTATTLTISNTQTGVVYEWYTAATNGSLLFTGAAYTTPVLNATTIYYVQAVSAAGCANASGRVAVTVTVTPRPAVPVVGANNLNICIGNTAVLTVTNAVAGVTYTWYNAPTGGTVVGTGASFTTPTITANIVYYVEAASGSCQSTSRTPVTINALPVPVAPTSVTSANGSICAGSTTVLTVNNPDANLNYRWYSSSSSGIMLFEGISFTTPALTTNTTYYVESVSKSGGCPSNTRTAVTVTVLPVLSAPVLIVQSVTPNSVTFAWNNVTGATAYEVSLNNGTTWLVPSSGAAGTTHLVGGIQPGVSVNLIVRAKGTIDCQTSANSNLVTGTSSNPFANDLFVPNTFTPNGDGKNDYFLAFGNSVSKFRMRVYNQWGEFIFESNALTTGWDGRWKGNMQPNGVYVYYIDVTFNDGTTKMLKGTITLLR